MSQRTKIIPLYQEEKAPSARIRRLNPTQIETTLLQLARQYELSRMYPVLGISRRVPTSAGNIRQYGRYAAAGESPLAALAVVVSPILTHNTLTYATMPLFEQRTKQERHPEPLCPEEVEEIIGQFERRFSVTIECQLTGIGSELPTTTVQRSPVYPHDYYELQRTAYFDRDREGNPLSALVLSLSPISPPYRYTVYL